MALPWCIDIWMNLKDLIALKFHHKHGRTKPNDMSITYTPVWKGRREEAMCSFSKVNTLNFIGFLLKRGLKGDTIASYMSSVRTVHIYKGYSCPALKDDVVEAVIGGAKNRDLGDVGGGYLGGKICSNSFHAGLATAMARAGHDEAVIKQMWRWKSEAYIR